MDNITEPDCLDTAIYSCVLRWGRANGYIVTCSPGNKAGIRLKVSGVVIWFVRTQAEGGLNIVIADQHEHFMVSSVRVRDVLAFESALVLLIAALGDAERDPSRHCLSQIQHALQNFESVASGNVEIGAHGQRTCVIPARTPTTPLSCFHSLLAAFTLFNAADDDVSTGGKDLIEPLWRPDMIAQRILGAIQYGLKHRERFAHD